MLSKLLKILETFESRKISIAKARSVFSWISNLDGKLEGNLDLSLTESD